MLLSISERGTLMIIAELADGNPCSHGPVSALTDKGASLDDVASLVRRGYIGAVSGGEGSEPFTHYVAGSARIVDLLMRDIADADNSVNLHYGQCKRCTWRAFCPAGAKRETAYVGAQDALTAFQRAMLPYVLEYETGAGWTEGGRAATLEEATRKAQGHMFLRRVRHGSDVVWTKQSGA